MQRSIDNNDFQSAANYVTQILAECIASERHLGMKFELLLRSSQLTEAVDYSK